MWGLTKPLCCLGAVCAVFHFQRSHPLRARAVSLMHSCCSKAQQAVSSERRESAQSDKVQVCQREKVLHALWEKVVSDTHRSVADHYLQILKTLVFLCLRKHEIFSLSFDAITRSS